MRKAMMCLVVILVAMAFVGSGCGLKSWYFKAADCNPVVHLPSAMSKTLFTDDLGEENCKEGGCERICIRTRIVNDPDAKVLAVPHVINTEGQFWTLDEDTGTFTKPARTRYATAVKVPPPWKIEFRFFFLKRQANEKGSEAVRRHKDFCNEVQSFTYDCFGSTKCNFLLEVALNAKEDDNYEPAIPYGTCQIRYREVCDGKDNDGDGKIDNGLNCPVAECKDGETRNCTATEAKGECKAGTQTCNNDKKWGTCVPSKPAAKEECNGKDDDCNGSIDENLTRSCYDGPVGTEGKGLCKAGSQTCKDGKWDLECRDQVKPTTEICDAKDNNCDGQIDEGNVCGPCNSGDQRDCYSGPADTEKNLPCKKGQQTCGADRKWGACQAEVTPQKELCDGIDNDCNGKVDDAFTKKGQACTVGVGECQRTGTWVCTADKADVECSVQPGTPAQELCDGKDNNCDGQVDENLSRACYNGAANTKGVGECKEGTETCTNGTWSTCSGQVLPQNESCNNKDDNCDGSIDENLTRACYAGASGTQGVGPCKGGTETCSAGNWGSCVGQVTPVQEVCDSVDNNCDGQVDEGGVCGACTPAAIQPCTDSSVKGECQNGSQTCTAQRQWGTCVPSQPQAEICGNNKDEDCDGTIDNGCTTTTPWTATLSAALHLVGYTTTARTTAVGGAFKGSMVLGSTTLTSASSTEDCFVAQLDATGKFSWAVEFKGTASEQCRVQAVSIDANGNVVATGYYNGSVAFGGFNLTGQGGPHDIFVVKLDSSGKVLWAMSGGGGSSIDVSRGVTTDSTGNVYITGQFNGGVAFGTHTISGTAGSYDVLVAKLASANGNWDWAVKAGSPGLDDGYGIVASGSSLYVTGKFRGNSDFGSLKATTAGGDDGFVVKLDVSGAMPIWSQLFAFGGAGDEAGRGITVDSGGNPIVTGYHGPGAKFGVATLPVLGGADVFVALFDPTLTVTWVKSAGSNGADDSLAIAVDGSGAPHVCGLNAANASLDTQTVSAAGSFAARLTSLGVFNWASSFGAGICRGVGVDTNGGVVTVISPATGSGGSVRYIPKP